MFKIFCFLFGCSFLFGGGVENLRETPWFTSGAVEFLENYLQEHPHAVVLEFGSGASTFWLAKRTSNLHSIEYDVDYYAYVKKRLAEGGDDYYPVNYVYSGLPNYLFCKRFPDEFFDVVLVDGRRRKNSIIHSIPKLKPGGLLLLDDSQRQYYHCVFDLMEGWQHYSAPEEFKSTDWWIKPQ